MSVSTSSKPSLLLTESLLDFYKKSFQQSLVAASDVEDVLKDRTPVVLPSIKKEHDQKKPPNIRRKMHPGLTDKQKHMLERVVLVDIPRENTKKHHAPTKRSDECKLTCRENVIFKRTFVEQEATDFGITVPDIVTRDTLGPHPTISILDHLHRWSLRKTGNEEQKVLLKGFISAKERDLGRRKFRVPDHRLLFPCSTVCFRWPICVPNVSSANLSDLAGKFGKVEKVMFLNANCAYVIMDSVTACCSLVDIRRFPTSSGGYLYCYWVKPIDRTKALVYARGRLNPLQKNFVYLYD